MDLTTLTWVASLISAGKIFYDLGSSAVKAVNDDDSADKPAEAQPSQLTKVNGVNKAEASNEKGASVDYDA